MAVTLLTTIKRFMGTAVEMVAMDTTGLPVGSTFFQFDTGLIYALNGSGNWGIKKITGDVNLQVGDTDVDNTNPVPTQLTGSSLSVDPETGVKTVTSTAAEVFAGLAALDGRYALTVYNEGANNVYWGKGTVTPQTGFPIIPGDGVTFKFNPSIDIPIFFVAETNVVVRVGELA
jgi:hypothetical protein